MKTHNTAYRFLLTWLTAIGLVSALIAPSFALAQTSRQVNITLTEFKITPDKVSVPRGEPVQFTVTNAGTVEHNFVVELEDQGIEKEPFEMNLKPGETRTAEFTFSVAGDWEMYCPVDGHKDHGMMGELEVVSASPAGMPATGSPATEAFLALTLLGVAALGGGWLIWRRQPRYHRPSNQDYD
ncbi:MAG TPA: cupredoxin domain-containing protein [Chloroflexia bacterium]|jgi:uncharacterized cupredoxin-like copper-binding protein